MVRRGKWVIGGVAVGVGALVLSPESRTWLRRRLGLEPEDRRWFEEENGEHPEHEGDEPLDTREARFSLRARLAEEGHGEPAAAAPAPEVPATEPPEPRFPAFDPPASPAFEATAPPAPEPPAFPAFESPATPAPSEPPEAAPPPFEPPAGERTYAAFESVPAVTPEADAPKTPGEDTNEIEALPPENAADAPAEEPGLPPPPTLLRPAPPPAPRPFSSEGASFRSAIDAARERVHGTAREATPDEGDDGDTIDERS
jgi:hypothetical protein